jgi:glycosyltransferase involved in cell wall biosynthesis
MLTGYPSVYEKLSNMHEYLKRNSHLVFAYVGQLQTRGRLLKQIDTLQRVGVKCEVILGNTESNEPDPNAFGFPVHIIPVDHGRGKLASFINQMRFCRRAAKWIAASGADTVVCLALESLMAGVWAKKRKPGTRLVFDNNELHLESFGPGLKSWIWRPIHNRAIRRCNAIFHAEPNRLAYFRQHYDAGNASQHVLENFPAFVERLPERSEPGAVIRAIYLGGYGEGRFTLEIMEAFAEMPDSVRLDIVGSGRPEFMALAGKRLAELGVEHVRLLPAVPYPAIPKLLSDYHIGVALYRNINLNNYYCAPNKVYDYLMNGLPVITNRYPGLVNVIENNRVGACIEEVNGNELRKAVEEIVDERLWNNITQDLRRRYCWERQEADYLRVIGVTAQG